MSSNSVGLPNNFDRFREIWHVDFEFRQDANHCPVPVAMFAKEHRTGAEISMRRPGYWRAPTHRSIPGSDALVVSYSAPAEMSCFAMLGWPKPRNVLCTYTETSAGINGLDIVGLVTKRPSLLEACDLFDIPHMSKEHKAEMRDLILNHTDCTEDQWCMIEDYNREDVLDDIPLLHALAPTIDLPAALFRGRYLKAVPDIELRGLPIDVDFLSELVANWQELRMHYIRRNDALGLYDDEGSFRENRFEALIEARGWVWTRTARGRPELRSRTIGKMCKRYPELRPLQKLRDQIAELRLGAFVNTVGADGASRCPLMPFWTRSGRNQPQGRDKVFLLSLPSWRVVGHRADFGPRFGSSDRRQAHAIGAAGLGRKIEHGAALGFGVYRHGPADHALDALIEQGLGDHVMLPLRELRIRVAVPGEHFGGPHQRLAGLRRRPVFRQTVAGAEAQWLDRFA